MRVNMRMLFTFHPYPPVVLLRLHTQRYYAKERCALLLPSSPA